jgi:hypothetical protein
LLFGLSLGLVQGEVKVIILGVEWNAGGACAAVRLLLSPRQLMDHVDISNTVGVIDAFRVAGGATADLSSCLGF